MEKKVNICDECGERIVIKKCSVCDKELCKECGKIIYGNIYFERYAKVDTDEAQEYDKKPLIMITGCKNCNKLVKSAYGTNKVAENIFKQMNNFFISSLKNNLTLNIIEKENKKLK